MYVESIKKETEELVSECWGVELEPNYSLYLMFSVQFCTDHTAIKSTI